jgi:hypothetical protein
VEVAVQHGPVPVQIFRAPQQTRPLGSEVAQVPNAVVVVVIAKVTGMLVVETEIAVVVVLGGRTT